MPEDSGTVVGAGDQPSGRGGGGRVDRPEHVDRAPLAAVLQTAQRRGLLGGDLVGHLLHSEGFVRLIAERSVGPREGSSVLDLGSGAGVPGLVVAARLPDREVVLADASLRRCRFLQWAVEELGLVARVRVAHGRAEDLARGPLRETCGFVTSRAFGPAATTAECARGFLVPGGDAVISDPPGGHSRWPTPALGDLGFGPAELRTEDGHRFAVLEAVGPCPPEVPRRDGVPARRPRF